MTQTPKSILEIPGYAEAVARERIGRESAYFLEVEKLGPFDAAPFTLRHYALLRAIKHPLLGTFVPPSPTELVAFLWIVNPSYKTGTPPRWFLLKCRMFVPPAKVDGWWSKRRWARALIAGAEIINAARVYLADALLDFPEQGAKRGVEKSFYSDVAWLCHTFAINYGWHDETTLRTPLKRLLQYYKALREHHGSKIMFNPSDTILGQYLSEQNRLAKQ